MRTRLWHIDESAFHELETFKEQMRFLLRYAILAPSTRNTQPWQFRITEDGVEVSADYTRRLRVVDPDNRELLMSLGAAITNFRVAAAHFGFETNVLYASRSGALGALALISVRDRRACDRTLATLFDAIPKRHTNRALFDREPLEPPVLARIFDAMERFPDTFCLVLPRDMLRAGRMIEEAERSQMAQPAFRAEVAEWIRGHREKQLDGLSADAFGVPEFLASDASWIVRLFDIGVPQGRRARRLAESASALLVVAAEGDRVSLIRAGEALEVLLLTIAGAGLQYSFLNQPVEVEAMRDRVRTMTGAAHPPQLLLRIGRARPVRRPAPRRPVQTVIVERGRS